VKKRNDELVNQLETAQNLLGNFIESEKKEKKQPVESIRASFQ